jgi:hypothetical protein
MGNNTDDAIINYKILIIFKSRAYIGQILPKKVL